jgi:hypothetical protein
MTAKIKLNAASGGGSFSLQAPSSSANNRVLTLPDAADGIVAQTDGSGNFAVSGTTTCTGNLKAGTITDTSGNNSSTTAQIAQGRAKMWVNFDGTGVTIRDSFNVAGIDDTGTGSYKVNIDNDMANANYCCVSAGNAGGGAGSKSIYINSTDADHTDVMSYDNEGNQQDRARISVAAFGDT